MTIRIISFFTLCVVLTSTLNAQSVRFQATIRNATTKQPLIYATVYSIHEKTGIYSDEQGLVKWALPLTDTIIVSFLSYESKKIAVNSLENNSDILLNETAISLNDVLVKTNKKRRKTYSIGFYDDPTEFDAWGIGIGSIAVNYIHNNTGLPGYLKTLLVDMGKAKNQIHRARARVRIYSATSPKSGPGTDLLYENIIFDIPRFSSQRKVDLTPYQIKFPLEGLFIGFEFLGFETKSGFQREWKQQTGGRVTSTKRDDYRSVGSSWRFLDTAGRLRWMNITDNPDHKGWNKILFKIGAEVESAEQ